MISIRAPQYRQHALISDCLDLAHLCLREEAALATNWIKDPPEGLKTTKPCTGHCGRTGDEQFTDIFDVCSPARSQQVRVLRTRTTIDPSRESFGTCEKFLPAYGSFSTTFFCRACNSGAARLLQGTLGGDFDIFAASGESTVWVLLWKTRSRPIGVRVCLVAHFNFSTPHLARVRGQWLCSGRKILDVSPNLIILENEGGDETNCPSPPPNSTFFDDPDVPFGPQGPPPPAPGPPEPPPGWPPR